jgi:hypothetical protein
MNAATPERSSAALVQPLAAVAAAPPPPANPDVARLGNDLTARDLPPGARQSRANASAMQLLPVPAALNPALPAAELPIPSNRVPVERLGEALGEEGRRA